MSHLYQSLGPSSNYCDKVNDTRYSWNQKLLSSTTVYVGNLSFYTTEEQIYELFSKCGEIELLVMGLNRKQKNPCGFCFIKYYSQAGANRAVELLNYSVLDERIIRVDWDSGEGITTESRRFGRGEHGMQWRDEFRTTFDEGRGGYGGGVKYPGEVAGGTPWHQRYRRSGPATYGEGHGPTPVSGSFERFHRSSSHGNSYFYGDSGRGGAEWNPRYGVATPGPPTSSSYRQNVERQLLPHHPHSGFQGMLHHPAAATTPQHQPMPQGGDPHRSRNAPGMMADQEASHQPYHPSHQHHPQQQHPSRYSSSGGGGSRRETNVHHHRPAQPHQPLAPHSTSASSSSETGGTGHQYYYHHYTSSNNSAGGGSNSGVSPTYMGNSRKRAWDHYVGAPTHSAASRPRYASASWSRRTSQ